MINLGVMTKLEGADKISLRRLPRAPHVMTFGRFTSF